MIVGRPVIIPDYSGFIGGYVRAAGFRGAFPRADDATFALYADRANGRANFCQRCGGADDYSAAAFATW
jgi:hypothetical protein